MLRSCKSFLRRPCVTRKVTDGDRSDYSGNHSKLSKILLNGNNICMVRLLSNLGHRMLMLGQLIPGGEGPVAAAS